MKARRGLNPGFSRSLPWQLNWFRVQQMRKRNHATEATTTDRRALSRAGICH